MLSKTSSRPDEWPITTMNHAQRQIDPDNQFVQQRPDNNPYRTGAQMVLRRLRWDLRPASWSNRRRLRAVRDTAKTDKAVICCNGPSLLKTNFGLLADHDGVASFGLNKINLLYDKTDWRPDHIVSVNPLVLEQNAAFFNESDTPLFLSSVASRWIRSRQNTFLLNNTGNRKFARDVSFAINQGATVTYTAMQVAFHLGYREIALVGCDHNFTNKGAAHKTVVSGEADADHFDPRYFAGGVKWQLPDLVESERQYMLAGAVYEAFGGRVVNCTAGGKLEIFPRMSLEEFVATP